MTASQSLLTHADVTVPAAAATLLIAANPNRVAASATNTGGSNVVRVGDANVSATQGIPLTPNFGNTELDVTEPIYGYSVLGTTVGITETVRP